MISFCLIDPDDFLVSEKAAKVPSNFDDGPPVVSVGFRGWLRCNGKQDSGKHYL